MLFSFLIMLYFNFFLTLFILKDHKSLELKVLKHKKYYLINKIYIQLLQFKTDLVYKADTCSLLYNEWNWTQSTYNNSWHLYCCGKTSVNNNFENHQRMKVQPMCASQSKNQFYITDVLFLVYYFLEGKKRNRMSIYTSLNTASSLTYLWIIGTIALDYFIIEWKCSYIKECRNKQKIKISLKKICRNFPCKQFILKLYMLQIWKVKLISWETNLKIRQRTIKKKYKK